MQNGRFGPGPKAAQLGSEREFHDGRGRQMGISRKNPPLVRSRRDLLDMAKILLESGADVNKGADWGASPLYGAAFYGHLEMARLLIRNNADVNKSDRNGWTPLHQSSGSGHFELSKLLVESKADVNKITSDGKRAIFEAVYHNRSDIVRLLLENKAEVKTQTSETLLDRAAQNQNLEVVKLLMDHNKDIGLVQKANREKILHQAAQNDRYDIAKRLIGQFLDIKQSDKPTREKILYLAARNNDLEIVREILQTNAQDQPNRAGYNALTEAMLFGNPYIWFELLGYKFENPKFDQEESKEATIRNPEDQINASMAISELHRFGVDLEKKLGSGSFGDVWRGTLEGKSVAVKLLRQIDSSKEEEILDELGLLGAVQHPNIIRHLKFVPSVPAIVMELAAGDLGRFLKERKNPIDWQLRMKWATQLTDGLVSLHSTGIIHRDLRCVNILLTKDLDVKISDFGVSVWFDENGNMKKKPFYIGEKKLIM